MRPDRNPIESELTDVLSDVRVLELIVSAATDSPRVDRPGESSNIMVDEETFIAWQRACDHVARSVRELSRVFYGEPKGGEANG